MVSSDELFKHIKTPDRHANRVKNLTFTMRSLDILSVLCTVVGAVHFLLFLPVCQTGHFLGLFPHDMYCTF